MPLSNLETIPLLNLKRQQASVQQEIQEAMAQVIDNTAYIGGAAVQRFEENFARFCQAEHCVGVGNGTDALTLIFWALELKPGDEVITTPMTFIASAEAISRAALIPVFADIEPDSYNLDPEQVKQKITPHTRAILAVHLYGQPASLAPLQKVADEHQLVLIEDSAQAHGAEYNNRRIGSIGRASGFSFYPGKNLGAFGDAGAVTTSDAALADKIRRLADHGRLTKYEHELIGTNSRLDALQAAVLDVKLKHLANWNRKRAQWAARYSEGLSGLGDIVTPATVPDRTHVFHQYVIQTTRRDELMEYLKQHGVTAGLHYPLPLHLQPAYRHLDHQAGDFPISEGLANRCLSLPMFAELTEEEVTHIVKTIRAFYTGG